MGKTIQYDSVQYGSDMTLCICCLQILRHFFMKSQEPGRSHSILVRLIVFFSFLFFLTLSFFCHFTDRYIDRSWCLTGGDREGPVIGKWVSLRTQTVTQPPDWTPRPGESLLFSIYGWPKLMASSQPAIVTVPVASPWQPHNVSICKLGDLLITREGCKEPPLEGSDACFFLTVWSDLELSLPSVTPGCVTHYIIFYTS